MDLDQQNGLRAADCSQQARPAARAQPDRRSPGQSMPRLFGPPALPRQATLSSQQQPAPSRQPSRGEPSRDAAARWPCRPSSIATSPRTRIPRNFPIDPPGYAGAALGPRTSQDPRSPADNHGQRHRRSTRLSAGSATAWTSLTTTRSGANCPPPLPVKSSIRVDAVDRPARATSPPGPLRCCCPPGHQPSLAPALPMPGAPRYAVASLPATPQVVRPPAADHRSRCRLVFLSWSAMSWIP
jgi:hypothetical protein